MARGILTTAGVLILAGAIYLVINRAGVSTQTPGHTFTVTLTENGFQPSSLAIKKGDAVTFKTTAGKIFWPASNPHPIHDIYSEFDPREPIEPGSSWTFIFNNVGSWKYHDHLNPLFTGEVIVGP